MGAIGGSDEGLRSSITIPVPVPHVETVMHRREGLEPNPKRNLSPLKSEWKRS